MWYGQTIIETKERKMANPNRTIAAYVARANNPRAMFVADEMHTRNGGEADRIAEEWKATGNYARVAVTSVKCGPRGIGNGWKVFYVRGYKH